MAGLQEKRLAEEAARTVIPGEHILAAVSGGADSVALLRLLAGLRDRGAIRLSAAHFEHGIRGEESIRDMRFVQDLCKELRVPVFVGSGDVPGESKRLKKGLEETARDMRRAFLMETKERVGADAIALAHHADDQAETVLMRLMRGSGGAGAAGMRERDGAWLRPLLHCRKQSLIDYLLQGGWSWREDATNAEEITPRNSLRLRVMPEIERIWPGAVEAMGRFAAIQGAESDLMDQKARQWLEKNAMTGPLGVRISLGDIPEGAILARAMKIVAGRSALATDVERLCGICAAGKGKLDLRGAFSSAQAAGGEIWFFARREPVKKTLICLPGATEMAGLGRMTAEEGEGKPVWDDPHCQELNWEACEGARLRLWQEGDRIRPLGMRGRSRLLSDVYADKGVLPQMRRFMPVLEADGGIVWAVGACIAEDAKLTEGCRAIRLRWEPAQERPWENTKDDGGF